VFNHLCLMHAPFSPDCPNLGLQLFKPLFFHEVRWICFSTSGCSRTRGIINVQDVVITSHCQIANIEVDNMEAVTKELFLSLDAHFSTGSTSLSACGPGLSLSPLGVCWFVSFVCGRLTTGIRWPSSFISQAPPSEVTGTNLPCHMIFCVSPLLLCQPRDASLHYEICGTAIHLYCHRV